MTAPVIGGRTLHFPEGYIHSGKKWRACCHCGWTTTPRVSRERAAEALDVEHGHTQGQCGICEIETEMFCGQDPWVQFRPLADPNGGEFYVCRDMAACGERYEANRRADLLKCGCYQSSVMAIGHYHQMVTPAATT